MNPVRFFYTDGTEFMGIVISEFAKTDLMKTNDHCVFIYLFISPISQTSHSPESPAGPSEPRLPPR